MKIKVCIGSSCHLKGSREVVQILQSKINDFNLQDKVSLSGKFCMGQCQTGVNVLFNEELVSVTRENIDEIFKSYVLDYLSEM